MFVNWKYDESINQYWIETKSNGFIALLPEENVFLVNEGTQKEKVVGLEEVIQLLDSEGIFYQTEGGDTNMKVYSYDKWIEGIKKLNEGQPRVMDLVQNQINSYEEEKKKEEYKK